MKKSVLLALVIGAIIYACTRTQSDNNASPVQLGAPQFGGAYNPPPVRSFPARKATVDKWISTLDNRAIRAHGWDIWESVNTLAPDGLPIWENWFSGYEVFQARDALELRNAVKDFADPAQFFHASVIHKSRIPLRPNERPTSFNRFSPSLAHFIYNHRFNKAAVLDSINNDFNKKDTPIAGREISTSKDSTDAMSFALKPVFQFIAGTEPSAIPYWAGVAVQSTTSLTNPEPHTWRQCVVVDPSGRLKAGEKAVMPCNGEAAQEWPVVALESFYAILITPAQAKMFSEFAATSGDDIGGDNQSDSASVVDMVKAGNYALLTAMHVTGKENTNWTWQTFWWSPNPDDPIFGNDRPKTLKAPWSNYNMNTAYYMVAPPGTDQGGEPLISYNPYLETNLSGTLSKEVGSKDTIQWYGVFSNCMSCHRMAAWKNSAYIPNGNIDPGNPVLFKTNTKTDFLWSIPTRAQ